MTLHFSQIFLTLGRTFIFFASELSSDLAPRGVVSRKPQRNAVTRDESNQCVSGSSRKTHSNLPAVFELHAIHGAREYLEDGSGSCVLGRLVCSFRDLVVVSSRGSDESLELVGSLPMSLSSAAVPVSERCYDARRDFRWRPSSVYPLE